MGVPRGERMVVGVVEADGIIRGDDKAIPEGYWNVGDAAAGGDKLVQPPAGGGTADCRH